MTSNNQFTRFKSICLKEVEEINKKYQTLLDENIRIKNEKELLLEDYHYLKNKVDDLEKNINVKDTHTILGEYQTKYENMLDEYSKLEKLYTNTCCDFTKLIGDRDSLLEGVSEHVQKIKHFNTLLSQYKLLVRETDYIVKDGKRTRNRFFRNYTRMLIEYNDYSILRRVLNIDDRNSWVDYNDILHITRHLLERTSKNKLEMEIKKKVEFDLENS